MNNIKTDPVRPINSPQKATPKPLPPLDQRSQISAKRALSKKTTSEPKRQKIKAVSENISRHSLVHYVEQNDTEGFSSYLKTLKTPQRISELNKVIKALTQSSSEKRMIFEPYVVNELLSTTCVGTLFKACQSLSKLPYSKDECFELQVIHGNAIYLRNRPEEVRHYRVKNTTGNTLLHIAAASHQFECFHVLTNLGMDPLKVTSQAPPIRVLIRAIEDTCVPLAHYDDLFEASFKPDQAEMHSWQNAVVKAAEYGIFYNSLELLSYARRRAGANWLSISQRIATPNHLATIGTISFRYKGGDSLSNCVNLVDGKKRNLLHWAIALGNIDLISTLVRTPLLTKADQFKQFPLHIASTQETLSIEIFTFLFESAPYIVYEPDQLGKTPFHLALEGAHFGKLQTLGENRSPPPDIEKDPLVIALFAPKPELKHLSFDSQITRAGANALHFAAALKNLPLLRACLATTGDWFRKDAYGATPLSLAVESGFKEGVEELCKVMQQNPDAWTQEQGILHLAFQLERFDILHLILDYQPPEEELNRLNAEGASLLHLSTEYSHHVELTKHLLKRGAKPDLLSIDRLTPLHTAHVNHVELLIEGGADINQARNNYKNTPLHLSLSRNDFIKANLLVSKGANPWLKNLHGLMPLGLNLRKLDPITNNYTGFIDNILKDQSRSPFFKVVAMHLLTNMNENISAFIRSEGIDPFKEVFAQLAKLSPTLNPEEWIDYLYTLDTNHFQFTPSEETGPVDRSLTDWKAYLTTAPIDSTKRATLEWWIDLIEQRKDYEGVPKDPQEKTEFYDLLETKLRHILSELVKVRTETQTEKLHALHDSARRCGGAWKFDTAEVESELNPALSGIKEQIYQIAQTLQEHILKEFSMGNVHQFFGYLIPLKELIPALGHDRPDLDKLAMPINPVLATHSFLLRYCPTQLIDTLLSELADRKPNQWMTWLRSFVPPEEQDSYIDSLYDLDNFKWTRRGAIELLVRSGILKSI